MKSIFNKALFKEQLRRFWSLSILSFFIYFVFIIMPVLNYNDMDFEIQNDIIIITSLFFPAILVRKIFAYLFDSKEYVTINLFSVNKTDLYFTNMLAGFVLMIGPLLILFTFNLMTAFQIPLFEEQNFIIFIFSYFLKVLLIFIFNYTFYLFVAHISENINVYFFLIFVLPSLPAILFVVCAKIIRDCFFGIRINDEILSIIFDNINPINIIYNYDDKLMNNNNINYFIMLFFGAIFLFCISYYANFTRKQECIGVGIVLKPIKNIIIFSMCIFGMFLGGKGIIFIFFDRKSFIIFGIFLGFLIAYYITQIIFTNLFKAFEKDSKDIYKFWGCSVLILSFILVAITYFETYIPNPKNVVSISLYSGSYQNKFTDKKDFDDLMLAHKNIINNKDKILSSFAFVKDSYYITYTLKNGKTVKRVYNLGIDLAQEFGIDYFYKMIYTLKTMH